MYAGFWKRVAAYLIDYVLVMVCNYLIAFLIGFASAKLLNLQTDDVPAGVTLLAMLVILGFVLLYYVYAESSPWQATVGKRILGIKVTDEHGNRISFWRSLGRRAAMAISSFTFLIGYMMCGWTARKQCLHDKIAGCLVVNKNYVPSEHSGSAPRKMPVWAILLCCVPAGMFLLGILAALFLPSFMKETETSRAATAARKMQQISTRQLIHRMETGEYTKNWGNILAQPHAGLSDVYCMDGPQISNPQNRYKSCGGKKTWVFVLGPKEVTAWRTHSWKYRIVMPYETRVPECQTEDIDLRAFCKKLNTSWKGQNLPIQ